MRKRQTQNWDPAGATDSCNFHMRRPAVLRYAGTPICSQCAVRLGLSASDVRAPAEAEAA
jgi:hypothetical protein